MTDDYFLKLEHRIEKLEHSNKQLKAIIYELKHFLKMLVINELHYLAQNNGGE